MTRSMAESTGECPLCASVVSLRGDGMIGAHDLPGEPTTRCEGSDGAPYPGSSRPSEPLERLLETHELVIHTLRALGASAQVTNRVVGLRDEVAARLRRRQGQG